MRLRETNIINIVHEIKYVIELL